MKLLKDLVGTYLQEREFDKELELQYLFRNWSVIVGDVIANMCCPVRVSGAVLVLAVKDSLWSYQIANKFASQIIERTNRLLKKNKITKVTCRVDLSYFEKKTSKKEIKREYKFNDKRFKTDIHRKLVEEITDEKIRESFLHLIATNNRLAK